MPAAVDRLPLRWSDMFVETVTKEISVQRSEINMPLLPERVIYESACYKHFAPTGAGLVVVYIYRNQTKARKKAEPPK